MSELTSQQKKQWLRKYSSLNRTIEQLDRQINQGLKDIESLRSTAEKSTTTLTGMPSGGAKSREDIYIKLIDLSNDVNRQVDAYVDLRRLQLKQRAEITKAIMAIDDPNAKKVIVCRYCWGWEYEEIAVEMCYCIRHIWRLHGEGLRKLEVAE